jgi:catalase
MANEEIRSDVGEGRAPGERESEAARIVDAISAVFGPQRRHRAIHAKGIVLDGTFTPSPGAGALSRAPHLHGEPSLITVRFSNFSGNPDVADTDAMASPRGMALRFALADGTATDIVAHSFDGFPVATAAEFRELLLALAESGPSVTHPTPADRFLATHPRAQAFLAAPKPPPVSFATLRYFGANSFFFVNDRGTRAAGRYRIEPGLGERFLATAEAARADADYLRAEIRERVRRGPIPFTLLVQLAEAGDRIDDPSQAWPDTRRTVELGLIEILDVLPDNATVEQELVFSPAMVPDGIEPADPMLQVRSDAYGVSYARRNR